MPDREKTISKIEEEIRLGEHWDEAYRMIDLQLLIDTLSLLKEQETKIEQLNRFVNGFSRDAMPVVRCKYCKHSEEWYGDKRRCFLWAEHGIDVFEDGYCSYGRPKEGR